MKNDILQPVPIDNLALGEDLRKAMGTVAEQHELRQSIMTHGLINPITVKPDGENGGYIVVAGARRFRALKDLIKAGEYEPAEIPCVLYHDPDNAIEAAIAENTARADMHPMDECDAFARLVDAGVEIENIADRFGVSLDRIKRRLKLASVAPEIKDLYREGKLHLREVQAFTVSPDHEKQLAALAQYDEAPDWQRNDDSIRSMLTNEIMPAHTDRAQYVGLDAYRKAGGSVLEDLFSDPEHEETYWIEDAGLMNRLASEKLNRAAKRFKKKAAWVETMLDYDWQRFRHCEDVEPETKGAGVVLTINYQGEKVVRWLKAPPVEDGEAGKGEAGEGEASAPAAPPPAEENAGPAGCEPPARTRNKFSDALRADLCTARGKAIAHRIPDKLAVKVLIWQMARDYFCDQMYASDKALGVSVSPHSRKDITTAEEDKRSGKLRLEWLEATEKGVRKSVASFEAFMQLTDRQHNALLAEVCRRLVLPEFTADKRSSILEVLVRGHEDSGIPTMELAGSVKPTAEDFWSRMSVAVMKEVAAPYLGEDWFVERKSLKKKALCVELENALSDRADFVMPGFKPGAPDVNAQQ